MSARYHQHANRVCKANGTYSSWCWIFSKCWCVYRLEFVLGFEFNFFIVVFADGIERSDNRFQSGFIECHSTQIFNWRDLLRIQQFGRKTNSFVSILQIRIFDEKCNKIWTLNTTCTVHAHIPNIYVSCYLRHRFEWDSKTLWLSRILASAIPMQNEKNVRERGIFSQLLHCTLPGRL